MRGNNLNDSKKAFDNNINNAEDKNKTDSREKIAPIGRNLCIALVALCVVNIIAHLACYSRLPENVPIHWFRIRRVPCQIGRASCRERVSSPV